MAELLSQSDTKKNQQKRGFSHVAFSLGMLFGVALAAIFVLQQADPQFNSRLDPLTNTDRSHDPALSETVLLIEQALQQVSTDYIDEVQPKELAKAALTGMFTKLDKHSQYLDEEAYRQLIEQTDGEYLGIGIEVDDLAGHIMIISIMENSPADQIGLRIGDEILEVNGQNVVKLPYKELLGNVRGQAGTSVNLGIKRDDEQFDISLERDFIPIHSVKSVFIAAPDDNIDKRSGSGKLTDDGIAYIRITHFNEHTATDLENTLIELQNSAHPLYGLILDLRNNPGGLVNSAVAVADLFLQSGTIVSANGRAADADFKYQAISGEHFADLPLVVLINSATASAAEIVAAALKEQDRATLLGENSYGKGLVQTIIPIRSGALKLTTSRYYTPSGLSINERGVRPHVKVADSDMMMAVAELEKSKIRTLPMYLAIKDPTLLRAWQHLNGSNSRDQLAMEAVE